MSAWQRRASAFSMEQANQLGGQASTFDQHVNVNASTHALPSGGNYGEPFDRCPIPYNGDGHFSTGYANPLGDDIGRFNSSSNPSPSGQLHSGIGPLSYSHPWHQQSQEGGKAVGDYKIENFIHNTAYIQQDQTRSDASQAPWTGEQGEAQVQQLQASPNPDKSRQRNNAAHVRPPVSDRVRQHAPATGPTTHLPTSTPNPYIYPSPDSFKHVPSSHPYMPQTARPLEGSDAIGVQKVQKRSRKNDTRLRCVCACGCKSLYYMRTKQGNVQCAPCKKNTSGHCSELATMVQQPYGTPILTEPAQLSDLQYHGQEYHRPSSNPPNALATGATLAGAAFGGDVHPAPVEINSFRPQTYANIPTPYAPQSYPPVYNTSRAPELQSINNGAQSPSYLDQEPAKASLYSNSFSNEAAVDAHFAAQDAATEFVKLEVTNDALDSIDEDKRRKMCGELFDAILDDPVEASTDFDQKTQDNYNKRRSEAHDQCKAMMKTADHIKDASGRCDKLFYTMVRLHQDGIPKNQLKSRVTSTKFGYVFDRTSTFKKRFALVVAVVSRNKRAAYDLLTGQRLDDMVRAPAMFMKRKEQNCLGNGKKGEVFEAEKKRRKAADEVAKEEMSTMKSMSASAVEDGTEDPAGRGMVEANLDHGVNPFTAPESGISMLSSGYGKRKWSEDDIVGEKLQEHQYKCSSFSTED